MEKSVNLHNRQLSTCFICHKGFYSSIANVSNNTIKMVFYSETVFNDRII